MDDRTLQSILYSYLINNFSSKEIEKFDLLAAFEKFINDNLPSRTSPNKETDDRSAPEEKNSKNGAQEPEGNTLGKDQSVPPKHSPNQAAAKDDKGGDADDLIVGKSETESTIEAVFEAALELVGDSPFDPIIGTQYPETIEGDNQANVLEGSAADNKIYGFGGNDTLIGNGGVDWMWGGNGNDDMFGGSHKDYMFGEDGDDDLFGEDGRDELYGGDGNDFVSGGAGNDALRGNLGDDIVSGDEGDDLLIDNPGDDRYQGGEGADTFRFFNFNLTSEAGGGNDIIEDFELGVDTLQIGQAQEDDYNGLTFNEYIDRYASGGGEAGVVIEWANGLIRLPGIEIEDLNSWDIDIIL